MKLTMAAIAICRSLWQHKHMFQQEFLFAIFELLAFE